MRPGFHPTRRNRNIGTPKQGHGQNNFLCVASSNSGSGPFWQQLGRYQMLGRACSGRQLPIFVGETRDDCVHACSVADVLKVLNLMPANDTARLAAIVLRQPKRKEQILQPVWGRMAYWAVVMLEAMDQNRTWWRSKSMDPANAAELDRLAADGHKVTTTRSRVQIESSLEATRATQLYRTLPHEIGHWVDYTTKVPEDDQSTGVSIDLRIDLFEKFWRRPAQEREAFAHRYAEEFRARMFRLAHFPFPRIASWIEDGLRECDFIHGLRNQE